MCGRGGGITPNPRWGRDNPTSGAVLTRRLVVKANSKSARFICATRYLGISFDQTTGPYMMPSDDICHEILTVSCSLYFFIKIYNLNCFHAL